MASRNVDQQQLVLGALFVVAAGLMFALAGASIKMASANLSSPSIVFWRNAISLAILMPWALWCWPESLQTRNLNLILLRAVAVVASLYCYYFALSVIPIVDAVLLHFSSPIFVPLLGFLLYRFPINRVVLVAVAIGFVGITLVLKPGMGVFEPAALAALAAGVLGGLAVVAIWRMQGNEHPARIAFYFAFFGLLISGVPMLWIGEMPGLSDWLPLLMLGVFSTAAHLLLAYGCLIAPADRVITLDYSVVIFAAILGWLFWGEVVDAFVIVGTILVVGAGILVTRGTRAGESLSD
ncbi:MAG: DMT family transporter, partial [Acidiferrobacterales bacterium]